MLENIKNKLKTTKVTDFGALIALVLLVVIISIISPQFCSVDNFLSLLRQSSINGLIAFGMTLVILTGGIDLSVGSVLAFTAAIAAKLILMGVTSPIAMLIALVIGTIFGLITGLIITKGRIQPFIATLISMTVFRGCTLIFSGGKPISGLTNGSQFSKDFLNFVGKGYILGIPTPVWILAISFILVYFLLHWTTFGRKVYSTGSNERAASLAGIDINVTKIRVYAASGFFAALAGLILMSRLGSAQPTLGSGYELDAIAAGALGGISLSGGRGKIFGTLIGILIIAVLNNGLNIIGVSSYYQQVVKGLVILIAVLSDKER